MSGVEFFGGIMLILGLFTRIPAAMLAFAMLVAIKSAKWGDVDSLETLLGFEEATYFAAFMWLAIVGPGAASLDRLLVNAAGHAGRIDLRLALTRVHIPVTSRQSLSRGFRRARSCRDTSASGSRHETRPHRRLRRCRARGVP